ncbi:MAG: thioredoxin family protein [Sphingomonadales bacterium]|jgi:peroxiredoxin
MKNILFSVAVVAAMAFTTARTGYKPGDVVQDFKLPNVDGKKMGLSTNKSAKGYIVIFTCNHCPYSVAYEDRIIALHNIYASHGYPVVAINPNDAVQYPDDSYPEMQKRAKEKGFTFPYLHDESQAIATQWGAERTPHVYVVKKEKKKFVVKYVGAIDNNSEDAAAADKKYVEDAVNSLLAGKDPEVSFTKAIGCRVKWKKKAGE